MCVAPLRFERRSSNHTTRLRSVVGATRNQAKGVVVALPYVLDVLPLHHGALLICWLDDVEAGKRELAEEIMEANQYWVSLTEGLQCN